MNDFVSSGLYALGAVAVLAMFPILIFIGGSLGGGAGAFVGGGIAFFIAIWLILFLCTV